MHLLDFQQDGFQWIDANDAQQSTLSFLRKGTTPKDSVIVVCNFTPVPRHNFRVGAPDGGLWQEALNSDAGEYGGSNVGNLGSVEAAPIASHGMLNSLYLTLPPLGVLFLRKAG